jgi:hypothetical protein
VKLPKELRDLTEKLAENVHENWARERIAEGWSFGSARDERARRRPDLVPYRELPESEKGYDRRSAMETLKAIIALGYTVAPPAAKRSAAGGAKKKATKKGAPAKARRQGAR